MSNKERKHRDLLNGRIKRIKARGVVDTRNKYTKPPAGSVLADHAQLSHNNTYDFYLIFYVDKLVLCRDCGTEEVWTAGQQKWWYEVAKGNINSEAVKCRSCRKKDRERKARARKIHLDGVALKKKLKKK